MWAAMALILAPLAGAQSYTVTDLGVLGGGYFSAAGGLNDYGTVVGLSSVANFGNASYHAFTWTKTGGMRDLGVYSGDTNSAATGINNSGDIVGTSFGFYFPVPFHAVLWKHGGQIQEIGSLAGTNSYANAINDSGTIVGYSTLADGANDAFLWTSASGMQDLGDLPGGTFSSAYAIDASGEVVGDSGLSSPAESHAFLWTQTNGMEDLGTLSGGLVSRATAINGAGSIVGYSWTEEFNNISFIWTPSGGMQPLNVGLSTSLYGINSSNQIVGSNISTGVPFLWTPSHHMQTLDSLVPPNSGWVFSEVVAINRVGQIAATGTVNGQRHAALLTPVN
jgi:probable HAF family extracellular repeat protein